MSLYVLENDIDGRYLSKVNAFSNVVSTVDDATDAMAFTHELAMRLADRLQDNGINMTPRILLLPSAVHDASSTHVLYNPTNFKFYSDTIGNSIVWVSHIDDATKLDISMVPLIVFHILHVENVSVDVVRHPITVAGLIAIASAEPVCIGYTITIGKSYYSLFNTGKGDDVELTTRAIDCYIFESKDEAIIHANRLSALFDLDAVVCEVTINVAPKETLDEKS